jgi:putative protein-disulfide isomerase
MQAVLIYCYDAWCGWCYGLSPVMKEVHKNYNSILTIEAVSGGMILPETPIAVSTISNYVLESYQGIEALTGVQFGEDYLWHMRNPELSDWFPSSEKSAIALSVFKDYDPEMQIPFVSDLQYALFYEGRDLTDDEAYRHLIRKYNINTNEFYDKLHSEVYLKKAYDEFALVQQLQVTGFPQLMLQLGNDKIYLINRGYSDYDSIANKINLLIYSN